MKITKEKDKQIFHVCGLQEYQNAHINKGNLQVQNTNILLKEKMPKLNMET